MFERYHRELLQFVTRTLGDRHHAADVVQETFVRLLAKGAPRAAGNEPAIREPRALLYRTAKNIVIDDHRRTLVRGHAPLDSVEAACVSIEAAEQPERRLEARQSARMLLGVIEGLPPRCKEAFILYKLDGMPQSEIAERMGITRNAVEKHVIAGMLACKRAIAVEHR